MHDLSNMECRWDFYYLATPYSYPDKTVMEQRYRDAIKITAHLMKQGYVIFSPIVHNHPIALAHNLPTDMEFWYNIDTRILANARGMYVADMDGWRESKGMKLEMDFCDQHGIPYEILFTKGILDG